MHTNRQRDVDGCEFLSLLLQRVDPQLAFLSATRSCCSVPLKEALPSLIRVVISCSPPATSGGLSGWNLNTAGQSKQRCLLLNATAKWKMLPDKHDALLSNAPVQICVNTRLRLFHWHVLAFVHSQTVSCICIEEKGVPGRKDWFNYGPKNLLVSNGPRDHSRVNQRFQFQWIYL